MKVRLGSRSRKDTIGITVQSQLTLFAAPLIAMLALVLPLQAGMTGEAVVNASGEVNDIGLRRNGTAVQVTVNGVYDPGTTYDFASLESIQVNGVRGDNTLTVDFNHGNPIPPGGLAFDCSRGFDTIVVESGAFENINYDATGPGAGMLDFDGSPVSFSGLDPIIVTSFSGTVTINVTDGIGHEIVVMDGPGIGTSQVTIDGGLENMVFTNPTDQLQISAGGGDDRITVGRLESTFIADIVIDGGTGSDTFSILPRFGGGETFISGAEPSHGDPAVPPGDFLALDLDGVPDAEVHTGAVDGWVSSATHGTVRWEGIETVVTPDRFELNESVAEATVLGSVPKLTLSDLSIHPRIDARPEPGSADIVLVVDESSGMNHAFLQDLVPDIETALTSLGVGVGSPARFNRYGLVGYGGAGDPIHLRGHSHLVGGMLFGTAAELAVATGTLVVTGDTEDGYDGIQFALDNYAYRADALRMIILVTDEDRDVVNGSLSFAAVAADLAAAGVSLHALTNVNLEDGGGTSAVAVAGDGTAYLADGSGSAVVSTGGIVTGGAGSTIADYADLVFAGTGLVGDYNAVQAGGNTAESFATALQLNAADTLVMDTLPADVDVFAYTVPVTGRLEVKAHFEDAAGALDLRVLDAHENVVVTASAMTDAELAILPVVAGETYYLEISGGGGAVNGYSLEVESFEAPVPDAVVLDPMDDTGWSTSDNVTAEPASRIFVEADLAAFASAGIDILSPAEIIGQEPGAAVAVSVNGSMVGYGIPVAGTGNTLYQYTFAPGELSTTFIPVGSGGGENLVKAAVEIFDGQGDAGGGADPASGRTLLSEPLVIVLDMTAPTPAVPDLLSASDDGTSDTDNVTSVNSPSFQGTAEARALLTLTAHGGATLLGTASVGDDGSDLVPNNGLGAWQLTAGPLAAGSYSVSASVQDPAGNTSGPSPPLDVTVLGPASASDDRVGVTEDQTVAGLEALLLANDGPHPPGFPHRIVSVNDVGTRGAVILDGGTGAVSYTATGSDFIAAGETDFDTFLYTLRDAAGFEAVAMAVMAIAGVNDPPVADSDNYSAAEDGIFNVPAPGVLMNDTDCDNMPTAALVSGPAQGSLSLSADGSFMYTPEQDFNGPVTFSYTAYDGTVNSNIAMVTIDVMPVPDQPVADAGGIYFSPRGRRLVLDGSNSYDPDESSGDAITAWDWDLDRDDFFGDVSGETVTLRWRTVRSMICGGLCRSGPDQRYGIRLQVEDSFGGVGRDGVLVDVVTPLFRETFRRADWPENKERWSFFGHWVNSDGRLVASPRRMNKTVARAPKIRTGVLEADLWLDPVQFAVQPNGALLFSRVEASRYRFVQVTPTEISIGQAGAVGSEPPGIKAAAASPFPTGKRIDVRVDMHPDGWVRVYIDGAQIPVVSHQFAEAVRGRVGLRAKKARSAFDNFYLLPRRMLR